MSVETGTTPAPTDSEGGSGIRDKLKLAASTRLADHLRQLTTPTVATTVCNQTNCRLEIRDDAGTILLVLAPLERRQVSPEQRARLPLDELRAAGYVEEVTARSSGTKDSVIYVAAFAGLVGYAALVGFVGTSLFYLVGGLAALLLGLLVVVREVRAGQVERRLAQLGSLALVAAIGVAVPSLVLYYGGHLGPTVEAAWWGEELTSHQILVLLAASLQLAFIVVASLLPALLYFLFDREQLDTLRERFTRQIFRLDPTIHTRSDIQAKYGALMDEVYGPPGGRGRLLPGTRSPILVATFIITFGWLLTLLTRRVLEVRDVNDLVSLFEPRRSAIVFAFLGAYFFGINRILRGYVRGDLHPKAYTSIAVRILIVVILAWVLELMLDPDSPRILALAFLAGVVPETVLLRLREFARVGAPGRLVDERQPLTDLEGIDLYDRARLMDEGVTNVEALAHHDLVELMLRTRIPAPQLVDWTDQAVLYLHLGLDVEPRSRNRRSALDLLRRYGIRTATDLQTGYRAAEKRGPRAAREFLDTLPPETDGEPPRLRVILDAMADEEWMHSLHYWHKPVHLKQATVRYPEDFADGRLPLGR